MDIGSAVGRASGVKDDQLRDLPIFRESAAFSESERIVLDYTVAMTRTPVDVSDTLFACLRTHFDDEQILELTAAIAWENYRARFDHALGIESPGSPRVHSVFLLSRNPSHNRRYLVRARRP